MRCFEIGSGALNVALLVTILQVFVFDKTYHPVLSDSALVHPKSATSVHLKVHFVKIYFLVSCFPTTPLNRTKLKCGTMKLMKKLYGWLSLVQYISSDQRVLFQCTQRVYPEFTLGCTSRGAINEGQLSNNLFTRSQFKICDHAANYLCIFCSNVWIWCDMTKGLKALFWMHPKIKLIEWNYRKAAVNDYTFNHWWPNFQFF